MPEAKNTTVRALFVVFRKGEANGVIREALPARIVRSIIDQDGPLNGAGGALKGSEFEVYELTLDMAELRARGKLVTGAVEPIKGYVVTIGNETRHFENPYEMEPVELTSQAKPSPNRRARHSLLARLRKGKGK